MIVLLVVVGAVGWWVRLQEVQQSYRQGAQLVSELAVLRDAKAYQAQQGEAAQRAFSESSGQLQDARWRLAGGEGMSELLDQLARSGQAHGLLLEKLDVFTETKNAEYTAIPLQVMVSGSYAALRTWLDEWLGQVRLLRVSSLRLVPVPGRSGVLSLHLEAESYHPGQALPVPQSLAHEPARPAIVAPRADPFQPWASGMVMQGLSGVPLAQLEMVGSLARAGRFQALLRSSGRIYRVQPGDRIGRAEGVVGRVEAHQVEVLEPVFVGGAWQQRSTYLALRKSVGKGGMDERERPVGSGDDDGSGSSGGGVDDRPG